jgi:prepilin-type N-terminal cleavage/methylation domain-containing protein
MKKNGFTLIELLAVILILGIIALIAIPTVNNIIQQSRLGAWETTGNNMTDSAEAYYQMCEIRDGKEADGTNDCNLTGLAALDEAALKSRLNIKGDIPSGAEIDYFGFTTAGDAVLSFKTGSFSCSNGTQGGTSPDFTYTLTAGDGAMVCTKP